MSEDRAKVISVMCMLMIGLLGVSVCGSSIKFDKICRIAIFIISVAAALYIIFKEKNNE